MGQVLRCDLDQAGAVDIDQEEGQGHDQRQYQEQLQVSLTLEPMLIKGTLRLQTAIVAIKTDAAIGVPVLRCCASLRKFSSITFIPTARV